MYRTHLYLQLTSLALLSGAALADEATGTISNIDLSRNTFEMQGRTFTASPTTSAGPRLEELEEGDEVTVSFSPRARTGQDSVDVMAISKEE
jgi:hypothetical protein